MLSYKEQIQRREEEGLAQYKATAEEFGDYCSILGLDKGSIEYQFKEKIGMLAYYPKLVEMLIPDKQRDKDGLYSIRSLLETMHTQKGFSGALQSDRFVVLFSKYFRRGFNPSMNWAPDFVGLFGNYWDTQDCYIRLDDNRVKINLSGGRYIEKDTWYGPAFSRDIELISDGNVKLVVPQDISDLMIKDLFGGIEAWDLNWATSGVEKVFQAMEFSDDHKQANENGEEQFLVRYLHAIYNLKKKAFVHTDGAMMFLTPEEYMERKHSDFNFGKEKCFKPEYRKLFKINGNLPLDDWMQLVSHFLHRNVFVFEYFQGSIPERLTKLIDDYRDGTGHYRMVEEMNLSKG